jgi:hypothetical protein
MTIGTRGGTTAISKNSRELTAPGAERANYTCTIATVLAVLRGLLAPGYFDISMCSLATNSGYEVPR